MGNSFLKALKTKPGLTLLLTLAAGVILIGVYFYSKNGSFFNIFPRAAGGASWACSWVWSGAKHKWVYKCKQVTSRTSQSGSVLTRSQIEHTYQTVGLSSSACKADPNSQDCIKAWNKCTENPQSTGCFVGWDKDPVTGQPVERLSGFQYQHNSACTSVDVAIGNCQDYSGP